MYDKHNLQSLFEFIWPFLKSYSNLLCLNFKRIAKYKKGKKTTPSAVHIGPSTIQWAEAQLTANDRLKEK
jgi:hypothetical protein